MDSAQTSPRVRPSPGLQMAAAPLFHAAWLFALGIVASHWFWFRPGWLLAGLLTLGIVAVLSILSAPRVFLPALAAVWRVLALPAAFREQL